LSREKKLKSRVEKPSPLADRFKSGETIYHYTSAEGFRGIVNSGEIWLTNTAFVNDTTECKAFRDLKRDDVFGTGPFPNEHVEEYWKRFKSTGRGNNYYIASFSKEGNLLQQFRAYGSFCIGFRVNELARRGFYLYDCVYRASDIRMWIRRKSVIRQWEVDGLGDTGRRGGAGSLLFAAQAKYKSEHYRDEREVRLFSLSDHTWGSYTGCPGMFEKQPPIHFRDDPEYRMPIPYVKFYIPSSGPETKFEANAQGGTPVEVKCRKLEEEAEMLRELLPITKVWVGPMARQEEERLACEILLQEKGYENIEVKASEIPYRGI